MKRSAAFIGAGWVFAAGFAAGCVPLYLQPIEDQPVPRPAGPTASQRERLADADAARAAGDTEAALGILRTILAQRPDFGTAYVDMGEIYLQLDQSANAEVAFARAARLEPDNFDAWYGNGLALGMLDRPADAAEAYQRALAIAPESVVVNQQMAAINMRMGVPQRAVIFAEKVLELSPDSGSARAVLGAIYEQTGRYEDAAEQFQKALQLMEPTRPVLVSYINVLVIQIRYRDAGSVAKELIRIDPSAEAYERLGWCSARLEELDESLEAYRTAVEWNPRHVRALTGLGTTALGKWLASDKQDAASREEAGEALKRSLQIDSDQPEVLDLLLKYDL